MSGPDEDDCPLCLQQHSVESPGASTTTDELIHLRVYKSTSKYSHIPDACFLFLSGDPKPRRNHVGVIVANLGAWLACTLILAYEAKALPCSVREQTCTCLLWSGRRTHVAQQLPVAMLPNLNSLDRYLNINQPQRDCRR